MNDFASFSNHSDEPSPWQKRFEDERVSKVLRVFKLRSRLSDLLAEEEMRHNERRLTFASFHQLFPTFPILLAARYRGRVADSCGPAKLFRSFESVFLLSAYREVFAIHQEAAEGRPIGMIVPFDGYRGGMIVHNGSYATRGTRMIHDIAGDKPPHRIIVEPFSGFINYLARGAWTADSPRPSSQNRQLPRTSRVLAITTQLVRHLGITPSLLVLAWVQKMLLSESKYDRRYVRRLDDSERCVKATHAQIACEVGISQQKVKRALESLRTKQLIAAAAPQARSRIVLTPAGWLDEGG